MLNNQTNLLKDEADVLLETGNDADLEIGAEEVMETEALMDELDEEQEAHREQGFYIPTREELLEDMGGIFRHLVANY